MDRLALGNIPLSPGIGVLRLYQVSLSDKRLSVFTMIDQRSMVVRLSCTTRGGLGKRLLGEGRAFNLEGADVLICQLCLLPRLV